jgi:hypothetical protein
MEFDLTSDKVISIRMVLSIKRDTFYTQVTWWTLIFSPFSLRSDKPIDTMDYETHKSLHEGIVVLRNGDVVSEIFHEL